MRITTISGGKISLLWKGWVLANSTTDTMQNFKQQRVSFRPRRIKLITPGKLISITDVVFIVRSTHLYEQNISNIDI